MLKDFLNWWLCGGCFLLRTESPKTSLPPVPPLWLQPRCSVAPSPSRCLQGQVHCPASVAQAALIWPQVSEDICKSLCKTKKYKFTTARLSRVESDISCFEGFLGITHHLRNTSCSKWLKFINPLINYLVMLPNFQIIERRVKLSPYVNIRHNFKKIHSCSMCCRQGLALV